LHQQCTIAEKVSCTGPGLHSAVPVQLTLHPARAGCGVVLLRRDGGRGIEIPVRPTAVSSTSHATTLACGEVKVATVEHLLAALHGLGIDNVQIEVDGPEVPVMDGSAAAFVHLLQRAGVYPQREQRAVLQVIEPVEIVEAERRISIEPDTGFRISYAIEFAHPAIGRQELAVAHLDAATFVREIACARTFGFLDEVNELWRAGLARGGSLQNTVVLDGQQVLNPEGLRWPDEFVRHKVLDLIGDLSLLGSRIQGHVRVERGGHSLHHRLVRALLATPAAWRIVREPPPLIDLARPSEARESSGLGSRLPPA